jgi:xenotropic and polytropic retrovirus receptor 1
MLAWWDIYMDFRLAQKKSPELLRDILAFQTKWVYYAAMVADPLMRMSWVAYVVFSKNAQHSSMSSYVVALIELFRRMIWISFRVENEHCVNIANNKASREIALPYIITSRHSDVDEEEQ